MPFMQRKTLCHYFVMAVLLIFVVPHSLSGQLSPGELSRDHAGLEGVFNCTKCHEPGEKVTNEKCLSCHQEIRDRINVRKGYHASAEVNGKNCAGCHSEHHGRNFDMLHFDQKKFNHQLSGYELTGKHKVIDCRECHQPDLVEDAGLKKRSYTYLGLQTDCKACHQDVHQNTLSRYCNDCHNTEDFKIASKFNHTKTAFPLVGKHKTVDCAACHQKGMRNGSAFQQFGGVAFTQCSNCHKDAHKGQLGGNCKECHTEQGFEVLRGMGHFNHNKTGFPLQGAHREVNCAKCHKTDAGPLLVFQDRKGVKTTDCIACHHDEHEGKFGTTCGNCHQVTQWRIEGIPPNFDHNRTNFALEGKHTEVNCKKCHTNDFLQPLPHQNCAACHEDYHEGQLNTTGQQRDCAVCHQTEGFESALFGLEEHSVGRFPLTGAHLATPCLSCHQKEAGQKWKFKNIGEKCVDCHENIHQAAIPEAFFPGKTCESCHTTATWSESLFDHKRTKFPLEGKHARTACAECHLKEEYRPTGKFTALSMECINCHKNIHGHQFDHDGPPKCTACHGLDNWKINRFNHNKTAFKLDGKHARVACEKCHKKTEVDGELIVQYKFASFKCADCHR